MQLPNPILLLFFLLRPASPPPDLNDDEESILIAPGFRNDYVDLEFGNGFRNYDYVDLEFGNQGQEQEHRQIQFEKDRDNLERFIHHQERMLGSLAGSGNNKIVKLSQSTSSDPTTSERSRVLQGVASTSKSKGKGKKLSSSDPTPSETKSKKGGRAEKKKQGVASTSKSEGKGKELSPEEEWVDSIINEDGWIKVNVEVLGGVPGRNFTVQILSEFSTVAQIKETIANYILLVDGDQIAVERIILPMVDPAGEPTEMEFPDHLRLRDINTHKIKLIVRPE